jgi:NifB/MoaA-like Fe-S oxidoreductase
MKLNKGVALLLERMKTNPEEFGAMSRWTRLLTEHDVLLDYPERKIVRPITFNREVMRRLLTAYDLERKGGALTRAEVLKQLLPGLQKVFDEVYENYTEEYKEKFNE